MNKSLFSTFWAAAPEGRCPVEYRGYFVRPYPPPHPEARAPRPGLPAQSPLGQGPLGQDPLGQGPRARASRPQGWVRASRLGLGLQGRPSRPGPLILQASRAPGLGLQARVSRVGLPSQHLEGRLRCATFLTNELILIVIQGTSSDISRYSVEDPIWARGPPITSNYPPARITDNVSPFWIN